MRRRTEESITDQIKRRVNTPVEKKKEFDGNIETMISTGSTLLDLAISGGRVRGGGIPGGIMVEIFGPSGSGKTVLLCEIAGEIQRKSGSIMFHDPEGRLNDLFAQIFDLDTEDMNYSMPDTVTDVFKAIRKWEPESEVINGIFTDSLAALSTNLEMDDEDGDKMGMRRAKEFSEGFRRTARLLPEKNLLMVCSNQIRQNVDAGPYAQRDIAPGGKAIGFYSSLRLKTGTAAKLKRKVKIRGKERTQIYGVRTEIDVFKSSIWKPHRKAYVTIDFDYGIDDIRENLKFVKEHTSATIYCVDGEKMSASLDKSIELVEVKNLENELRNEVMDLWEELEETFTVDRKKKKRN